jgi:transcription termination factor NusB
VKSKAPTSQPAVSPARAAAFDILLRVERESAYASELLHSRTYDRLTVVDHSLTTELVMGILRWRSLVDSQIAKSSAQPLSKLDPEILTALRLAVYQLCWLSRIPARAAINESVELVKRARKRSAAPFVNAVLRKLAVGISQVEQVPAARDQRRFGRDSRCQQRAPILARRTLDPGLRNRFRFSHLPARPISSRDRYPSSSS